MDYLAISAAVREMLGAGGRPTKAYVASAHSVLVRERREASGANTVVRVPFNGEVRIVIGDVRRDCWVRVRYRGRAGWVQSCSLRLDRADSSDKLLP